VGPLLLGPSIPQLEITRVVGLASSICPSVALRTATLGDETLLALRTFVDSVGRDSLLAPQPLSLPE
jgi:hypothetical protein